MVHVAPQGVLKEAWVAARRSCLCRALGGYVHHQWREATFRLGGKITSQTEEHCGLLLGQTEMYRVKWFSPIERGLLSPLESPPP